MTPRPRGLTASSASWYAGGVEYLRVEYYRRRGVLLDGSPKGFTNETLRVEDGASYRVTLGGEANYKPASRRATPSGTSTIRPLVLRFDPS